MARTDTSGAFDAPLPNEAFAPPPGARPAPPFEGVLRIAGGTLAASDPAMLGDFAMGGRPERFPAVEVAFASDGGELLPLERGLVRRPDPESYWDLTVGPGRLWSEPGDGRSRAAFPFQLSNERENDSHHGLARFRYDAGGADGLEVQIVTETEPDHLPEGVDLWGRLEASVAPGEPPGAAARRADRRAERAREHPIRPIRDLEDRVGAEAIDALADGAGSDTEIVSGLVVDGAIYATGVRARHGAYPYPRAMRFGLWSATKAAFGATALMRLAMHLGPGVAETRVRDVVEVAADREGWSDVTIRDCLDMATGIGTAGREAGPADIYADNLTEPAFAETGGERAASHRAYQDWYVARSLADKLACALACPSYPWGPGEVARYRDQDLFMAGAAMDAVWKRERGADADLFSMVADEVYRPIGMTAPDMNRTIEPNGATGVPLTAFGLYLGLDDVARLGRLLTDGGVHRGERLLEPSLLAACIDGAFDKGLPTGTVADGNRDPTYRLAYWQLPMTTLGGRDVRVPTMRGYGGQIVQPLWNGVTCFRFGHDRPDREDRYDALKLPRVADALRPL